MIDFHLGTKMGGKKGQFSHLFLGGAGKYVLLTRQNILNV